MSIQTSVRSLDATLKSALLGCISLAILVGGCAGRRAAVDESVLIEQRAEYLTAAADANYQSTRRLVRRLKSRLDDFENGRAAEPPVLDILILSGGGDFGAFGAGFLQGWGAVSDPQWKRPQFDVVSGVSTGALIAPFAFLGDDASYERAVRLYREPQRDWVRRRGLLFFLPGRESLVRIDGLKRDISNEFDASVVKRVADEAGKGKLLVIGTTNLDFGVQRIWDLGNASIAGAAAGSNERFVDTLLASSAIPGAFPAIEMDDHLYADGAVSTNILYNDSMRSRRGLTGIWTEEYPGVRMPRTRYWVVLNAQLEAAPQVVQPTWLNVTAVSLAIAVRSSTMTALQHLIGQLEIITASGIATKEIRYVSVPADWRAPATGNFNEKTMQSLSDLGMKMGADPASWKTGFVPDPTEPPTPAITEP